MDDAALTEEVIGCAFRVANVLGPGFLESVYEKALLIELRRAGLSAQSQVPISVQYAGEIVGDFVADILVAQRLIVEVKSVKQLATIHEVQLVNYLKATGIDVGLLLNFADSGKVEVRRKMRDYRPST